MYICGSLQECGVSILKKRQNGKSSIVNSRNNCFAWSHGFYREMPVRLFEMTVNDGDAYGVIRAADKLCTGKVEIVVNTRDCT